MVEGVVEEGLELVLVQDHHPRYAVAAASAGRREAAIAARDGRRDRALQVLRLVG